MKIRKYISKMLVAAVTVSALAMPGMAFAEEAAAGTEAAAAEAVQTGDAAAGIQQQQVVFSYKHTSQRYGYSILCPTKPKVIPASAYNEHDKGDVLIFSGTYDNIKKGWIICMNGYDDKVIPDNLGTMTEEEARPFLKNFAETYGLQYAQIVEIPDLKEDGTAGETVRYGISGPTATAVEVDTDGDGVMDSVAVAENQMLKMFIPGQYGGHYLIGLVGTSFDDLSIREYMNAALYTFQQWPTSGYDKAKEEAAKNPKKK